MKAIWMLLLILISSLLGFSQKNHNSFNIVRDIGNFSELMTELDTIVVKGDYSICGGEYFETDIITKKNDSVYIQVLIDKDINGKISYEKRLYLNKKSDPLHFETIYSKLQKRNILHNRSNLRFEIVHNRKDTLKLFTYGLMDILKISSYLCKVKDQIYFDKDYYKPLQIPMPLKGLSDEEKSDSIMMESITKEALRMAN